MVTETAAATTRAPRTSPWGILALGMIIAFLGATLMGEQLVVGWIMIAIGGVMAQFGVICAAVELAIVRSRER